MFRHFFIAVSLLVVFGGTVNAETGKKPDPQAVSRGKALYEKHCQTCHKKDGVGEP